MRDYLSIYLEQEEEEEEEEKKGREHVERAVDVVSKYDARRRARSALSPRMRDTKLSRRFGTVRFVHRLGMAHAAKRKRNGERDGGRERGKEREVKKTELFRGANVCAHSRR